MACGASSPPARRGATRTHLAAPRTPAGRPAAAACAHERRVRLAVGRHNSRGAARPWLRAGGALTCCTRRGMRAPSTRRASSPEAAATGACARASAACLRKSDFVLLTCPPLAAPPDAGRACPAMPAPPSVRGRDVMAAVDTTRRGRLATSGFDAVGSPAPLLRSLALHRAAAHRLARGRAGAGASAGKRRQSMSQAQQRVGIGASAAQLARMRRTPSTQRPKPLAPHARRSARYDRTGRARRPDAASLRGCR